MKTTTENTGPSKRKQEVRRLGFHFVTHTREESEANRSDYDRFKAPHRYMTEEELKYFKSDDQRELFKKMYWNK